jgi:folate-binding protein YgfZ
LEPLDDVALLDIEGPAAAATIAEICGDVVRHLEPWRHIECGELRVANLPRLGGPAFTLIGSWTPLAAIAERMKKSYSGVVEVGPNSLETLRIENGLARVGFDTDERTLALEARLEPAISFNKGCYLGQETIERATARGSIKRRLYGLRLAEDKALSPGAVIRLDGKEVGRLTSITRSPALGAIGLAVLHHSAWTPGARVVLTGETGSIDGYVCDLPFEG